MMNRRHALAVLASPLLAPLLRGGAAMRFGLVTYLWAKDWDLKTILAHCEKSGVLGVELRTTHAHGVERTLGKTERAEVKKRFAGSPVTLVGPGSDEKFHWKDPERLKKAIAATKEFLVLSHDVGGTGVKVKPDGFVKGVPRERTTEQIGKAMHELGTFAADHGQEVRIEAHGRGTQQIPAMKAIMEAASHPAVGLCWNSNPQDLDGKGLAHNFGSVRKHFGATAHVRELDVGSYPYAELVRLMVESRYDGWVLLEARTKITDPVASLIAQRKIFESFVKRAAQPKAARDR